ncbi:MAG: hypothetical protein K2X43_05525 [Hyphomonadaceae bacterium]|jgi:hypothetical protein|nr:hypothetical protein [Hyphomonadaceae bacterium]
MDWLIGELVMLAVPAYVFLQGLMVVRYRGRWRLLSLVPLLFMVPIAVDAGLAFAAGSTMWPLLGIVASPVAFAYLVGLATIKASLT